jgi:Cu+-exporting ATPase
MNVEYDENVVDKNRIIESVQSAGYGASDYVSTTSGKQVSIEKVNPIGQEQKEMKQRITVSFLFLIPLLYITMGHMLGIPIPMGFMGEENAIPYTMTQLLLTVPILYANRKYYQMGFKTLFHLAPNMDSLIAIGSAAAVIYGIFSIYRIGYGLGHDDMDLVMRYLHDLYFESAGTILTLITLGKYLEARSKGKTSDAIKKLIDLAPKTASILRDGVEVAVPVEEVVAGDIIVVRPGQSIPVDGIIVEGTAAIDQAAITGESIPVEKQSGDKVIAGTVNKSGFFQFKAEKVGDATTLAQIIRLVEEAGSSKAPISKLADKISGIFVPVVLVIAVGSAITWMLLGYSFEFALSIGISVLVISCPCALGLATPVAIMVGTGKGAQNGILIKSAEALETLHSIQTVVLDKTGTITEGKPRVTDIITAEGVNQNRLLEIAAAMEKPSEHPLAEAILAEAGVHDIFAKEVTGFKAVSGKGIVSTLDGVQYIAGNRSFMEDNRIDITTVNKQAELLAREGKTPLYFADGKRFLGLIAAADVIKETSRKAIKDLKAMGIDVVMLTGDHKLTAEAIRSQLDIDRVVAEVLPQDKEKEVRQLQEKGHKVAMIGDGINDAPALARADVGIAIGAGTDIAIEAADVVLMKSSLQDAVTAILLSRATIRNIRQNLFWAFFYNSLGIPLAAGVFYTLLGWKLNPMFGAAAMSLSSVFVVTNALRLYRIKLNHKGDRSHEENH